MDKGYLIHQFNSDIGIVVKFCFLQAIASLKEENFSPKTNVLMHDSIFQNDFVYIMTYVLLAL